MCWTGSGSQHDRIMGLYSPFNPFACIDPKKKIESLTERLQGTAQTLQWCLPTYGTVVNTDPKRGNRAVASQNERGSLSKPSYLALGTLRSYSFGQFRRLCAALCQRSFILDHPAVRTTVMQALYHLGTLYATDNGQVGLKWRAHWDEPDDVLSNLRIELDNLADELEETPWEHDSVLLLGTIAAYLSAWHRPCILTARRFVWMVYNAAGHLDVSIKEAELSCEDRIQQGLRERQNHLRKVSLLCYASGPFDNEGKVTDAAHMIELMVLINHGSIFMEGVSQSEESKRESAHLEVRCQNIMALAVDVLMVAVKSNPGCLSDAVRLVLPPPPETLKWRQLGPHASFEAEGADSHLYSINILDGTVLLDGSPPSRLPKEIVDHPMYRRAFGDIKFEVAKTRTGVMQTLKPVQGHVYNFSMVRGTLLVTEEADGQDHQTSLELLNVGNSETATCEPWGVELPRPWPSLLNEHRAELTDELVLAHQSSLGLNILAKLEASKFIHTYSTSNRPIMGNSSSPMGASGGSSARPGRSEDPTCKSEDSDRSERSEDFTCESEDPTRPGRSEGPSSKVETGLPYHKSMPLVWELPRYGLEFEYRDGIFLSRDYTGFKLADKQQLAFSTDKGDPAVESSVDFTLPNFQQYLVLDRIHQEGHTFQAQQSNRMIILPDGFVVLAKRETDGGVQPNAEDLVGVSVAVSGATDASIKIHRYEVHPRFGHLAASSILSRLQLAALYSATSSLLPEPRSRMTGAQLAMRLFASLYLQQSKLGNYGGWCQNSRMLLHSAEEESAMGISTSKQAPPHWIRKGEHCQLELSACSIPNDVVEKVEKELLALAVPQPRTSGYQSPPYPLLGRGEQDGATNLEVDMHAELKESWEAYHASPEFSLSQEIECVREHISTTQDFVTQRRKEIEQYLLQGLQGVPEHLSTRDGNGSIRRSFRMLRSADGAANAGLLDLMEAALHSPDYLLNYNPFLTERSCQVLHESILTWLQLCVLEDRLKRLELLCMAEATQKLVQELQVRRQWSVSEYPEWLVFEVEGGLQIRPQQYAVAARLIHEPGAIAQLNMVEGKTRVILPMLVLHLAKGEHVVGLKLSA
eukprot:gene25428-11088_t